MGYPTPDNLPAGRVCREIFIPDDPRWLAVYNGVISLLAEAWVWEKIGILTPEECADAAAEIYYEFVESECNPPPVPNYTEGCRIRRTTNQTINNASDIRISFDVADYDTDAMFNPAFPLRITINTPGKYHVFANVRWTNFVGLRYLDIVGNGVLNLAFNQMYNSVSNLIAVSIDTVWDFAAGEYVELFVAQSSGVAQSIVAAPYYSPVFGMQRIG